MPLVIGVVRAVERRRRALFLADRVHMLRMAQRIDVRRPHVRIERFTRRSPTIQRIANDRVRRPGNESLRQWLRLRQHHPRPIRERVARVRSIPCRRSRENIELGYRFDAICMI
jgi:hypothetical protein